MADLDGYLQLALSNRASDIHFSAGEPVRMRIDGSLVNINQNALTSQQLQQILFEILTEAEKQRFLDKRNLDKSYSVEGLGNFRVNIFMTRRGVAAVLRTIPSEIPTVKDLGLPDTLYGLAEMGRGLILVTGPTGSGKSTTLAAMLNHINEKFQHHILTAEDPVEFIHPCKKSLINQREIGNSCPTFADALKYALREDPDVILVGEMRDLETIALAITAAETGHMVFGTLHTRGAAASVDRIIDSFPVDQQAMIRAMLSESLKAVISQVLIKKASGQGRVAAYEIMVVNHAISNLIREGKTFQISSVMQTGKKDGMVLMDQNIRELAAAGVVTVEDSLPYVENASVLSGIQRGKAAAGQGPKIAGSKPSPGGASPSRPPMPGRGTGSGRPPMPGSGAGPGRPPMPGSGAGPGRPPMPGSGAGPGRPPLPGSAQAPKPTQNASPTPLPANSPVSPSPTTPKTSIRAKNFTPQPLTLGEETQASYNLNKPNPPQPQTQVRNNTLSSSGSSEIEIPGLSDSGSITLDDNEEGASEGTTSTPPGLPIKKAG